MDGSLSILEWVDDRLLVLSCKVDVVMHEEEDAVDLREYMLSLSLTSLLLLLTTSKAEFLEGVIFLRVMVSELFTTDDDAVLLLISLLLHRF